MGEALITRRGGGSAKDLKVGHTVTGGWNNSGYKDAGIGLDVYNKFYALSYICLDDEGYFNFSGGVIVGFGNVLYCTHQNYLNSGGLKITINSNGVSISYGSPIMFSSAAEITL